jgi:ABC-2 type transport system ATP-binding protein
MRLAVGLLRPNAGRIQVLGLDAVADPLKVQQTVGYMPQRFGLYEDLSVQENLDLYADLQGVVKSPRGERYEELMKMTGLGPFTGRLAGALSGGMKQKLGLACALVRSPPLLLLDEPTVGVDPVSRRDLWSIVYRLVEEEGVTVLLSTAYLDEAERCQEVLLMNRGQILGQAPPGEFSATMKNRGFQVTAPEMNKRSLQERLARTEGVLDAIIHGEGVRVLTHQAHEAPPSALIEGLDQAQIQAVEPRFEDSFVAKLVKQAEGLAELPERGPKQRGGEETVIEVRDVKRRFGDFYAVKGISFNVRHGEVFGLLGANGAGKSTTFRMLCGLLPATEGTLLVAGRDLRRAAAQARANIGYMAQHFSLYKDLSVLQNLNFFSRAYGLAGEKRSARIDWALNEFELAEFQDAQSGDLPLGYKQRLALAAALMHEPAILFLDEPTSGVDPLARREFWHRINVLAEGGVTILVTTHFMEEAEYCDRLVIMVEGDIMAQGTPEEMKQRYKTEDNPEPTMEDAFIGMIEESGRAS